MKSITFRDIERISAYLDGELSQVESARLEIQLKKNPEMAAALVELRQTRSILKNFPKRQSPRNFTLTHKMAGIKPPLPRSVPAFSWASAAALLLFIFTMGGNILGRFSFGAGAPMMAAPQAESGFGGGPVATEAPAEANDKIMVTATPEISNMTIMEQPPAPEERTMQATQEEVQEPLNPWLIVWPAVAAFFIGVALLIRWLNILAFRRKKVEE